MAEPLSELETRLALAREPQERIDVLAELAWQLRNREPARAHALATEARTLSIEHGYKLGQARSARTMAMTVQDLDGLRNIVKLGEEARRLFDELGDELGRAASRDFLASICEFMGDLTGGLELALDALSIAREAGDAVRQGYALSSVGGILAASGEVDTAVERLQEALRLFEGAREQAGIGTICSRLSKVLKEAGRYDEALVYAERCHDTVEESEDGFGRWSALKAMAELEEARGRLVEAEQLFRASLEAISGDLASSVLGAEGRLLLGRVLMRRGLLVEAERELCDALARVEGDPLMAVPESAIHDALADLRERLGELAPAIAHLRKAQALREQIAQQDARNKRAQVEARAEMEAARKDAEIHRLRFVELYAMQTKLVEAEKMALLGKLAAGTAHELNTPLAVLRSNTELLATTSRRLESLLRDRPEIAAKARKLASLLQSSRQSSDEAVGRIAAIARSFARFTQLDQAERRSFDVREGLDSAMTLLAPLIPRDIRLERDFAAVPPIEAWPRELNHAFLTVLQNAAQAIDGAGVVTAQTHAAGEHVLVRVRDTGRGMSEEQVEHLFDVAWSQGGTRTKMRLGLSAAYATVQKHGGTIDVDSAVGRGTTVTFRFPLPRQA